MQEFTFTGPLAGGALLGLGASLLLLFNGKVAGISGIFAGLLTPRAGEIAWRAAFIGGLILGGLALAVLHPALAPAGGGRPLALVVIAGLLVGYGTRLGNGCTSGHGLCGVSRLSVRSLVATVTFIATGAVAVVLTRHMIGGNP
ncbi:MAG: YeeE/YedE family protein [Polyangiaceae bacterium]|nr:YeeE/YedE family protein [Polyangiaceae bacterium]